MEKKQTNPEKMISKNLMEVVVTSKIEDIKDSLTCCRCDVCMLDIATYVLNRLPPKYVTTTKGDVFSKLDTLSAQYTADILALIAQAARVVAENPRHGKKAVPAP